MFDYQGKRTPQQVVSTALQGLERGPSVVIDGRANAILAHTARLMPPTIFATVAGQMMKPSGKSTSL